jgi:hypothetical protein
MFNIIKIGELFGSRFGYRPVTHDPNVCKRTGKWRHKSEGAADASIRSLVKRELHQPDKGELHAYECKCGAWHVGHFEPDARGDR